MGFSPVLLFVYNRIDHVKQTIEALSANSLSNDTDLIIYSDAAKKDEDIPKVDEVRRYIQEELKGFRSIKYVLREQNYGLTRNIIEGVSNVVSEYGRVIVLEDDIVVGPHFLRYMNEALEKYENEKTVFEISAYVEPIDSEGLDDSFFIRKTYCWGWATWADRWKKYERNPYKTYKSFNLKEIHDFNMDGMGSEWDLVIYNLTGTVSSWAVFWSTTVYQNKGLVLVPQKSLIRNIGCDGSGTNYTIAVKNNEFDHISGDYEVKTYPDTIIESEVGRKRVVECLKKQRPDILRRIWRNQILLFIEMMKWYFRGFLMHQNITEK